jgi:phosphatidate cytidylyltransferase
VLEFLQMSRSYRPFVPAALLAVALAPILAWKAGEPGIFAALLIALPLIMVFASLSVDRRDPAGAIMSTMAAVVFIAPAAGLAVVIRSSADGFDLILLMLAGIWVNDTAAYTIGRMIGRHKLAPRISPNKSIEGLAAGLLAGTFVVWYAGNYIPKPDLLTGTEALMLGIAIAVATPFGDLYESMLKRTIGVKDSSHLLGDHGGMLDRIDSLLTAIPATYLMAFLLGVL